MIKKCELSTCCNFFTVSGNRKKYCKRKCGIQSGRKKYKQRNWEACKRQHNERRRARYKADPEYREKQVQKAAIQRELNKDNEVYLERVKEHKLKYARSEHGRQKMYDYRSNREQHDLHYKMTNRLRNLVLGAIRRRGGHKSHKSVQLLGCSIEHAVKHLEKQFSDGMSWDNYGDWQIDHIKPCASFDMADPRQQKQCCHYTNLQPLWAYDNRKKGARYELPRANVRAVAGAVSAQVSHDDHV